MKHSPLPWRLWRYDYICDSTGAIVLGAAKKKDTLFIVLACNHFEELLTAAKEILSHRDGTVQYQTTKRELRTIIAKIEEEK